MSRNKPQPVRIRNPLSPGSGGRLTDLIKYPVPVFIAIRLTVGLFKHYLIVGFMIALLYILISTRLDWGAIVLELILLVLLVLTFHLIDTACRYRNGIAFRRLFIALYRKRRLYWRKEYFLKACDIKDGPPPRFKKLRFNPDGCSFKIDVSKNIKTSLDIAVNSPEIASAYKALDVKVDTPSPAIAMVFVNWGDPTSKIVRPGDVPKLKNRTSELPFAVSVNKVAVSLALYLSLLIVGRTQSGKSNIIWELLNKLNTYNIPYRIRVIDPKGGVELPDLKDSPNCIDYTDDSREVGELMDRANEAMHERFRELKRQGLRNIRIPTEEWPLDILIVDEMLHLDKYDANSKFGLRLSQGAAGLNVTWAMSQLSQVDALGRVRDLFPQRVCMAVESSDVTDAALGTNAEKRGAEASRISTDTPGVGYMFKDGKKGFTKFRVPKIEDDETHAISMGTPIVQVAQTQSMFANATVRINKGRDLANIKTAVYKLYNSAGRFLYVGIAWNPKRRFEQHGKDKFWWKNVDMSLTEIEWYPKRKEAKKMETYYITNEFPMHNKAESKTYKKERTSV